MKTIAQQLKKMPLQKRLQFMENTRKECFHLNITINNHGLLGGCFTWAYTRQGQDYWYDVIKKCINENEK